MKAKTPGKLKDGGQCKVAGGTHAGKSGTIRDINTSKTGYITITVEQKTEFDSRHWARMQSFRQQQREFVQVCNGTRNKNYKMLHCLAPTITQPTAVTTVLAQIWAGGILIPLLRQFQALRVVVNPLYPKI
jgi:hypothetical protein